jgi:hypothetical protein
MQEAKKILFYGNGDPIDHRCIRRFVCAFGKRYREVVELIIEKSERELTYEVFKPNIAALMTSFKMTRKGAFHGVKIDSNRIRDDKWVIDSCWKQIGGELQKLKHYLNERNCEVRGRVLLDLSSESKEYVIEKCSDLFKQLLKVTVGTGERVRPVGASKVLFASLPEVALPVDTWEWKHVFKTKEYREVLSTMVKEINEWEKKSDNIPFETLGPFPKATLPSIYNVMAMASRYQEGEDHQETGT